MPYARNAMTTWDEMFFSTSWDYGRIALMRMSIDEELGIGRSFMAMASTIGGHNPATDVN